MKSEAARAHRALVDTWRVLSGVFDDASFEARGDLLLALCPSLPMPQCNGPWVVSDSVAAVEALEGAIAEVDAVGAPPWVQTRSGHDRVRHAAEALGFTHLERLPGMVIRPGELVAEAPHVEIGAVAPTDVDEVIDVLAGAFEAPRELFDRVPEAFAQDGASWVAARVEGRIVSTAGSVTVDGATGVFNVATPADLRGRGYGAAVTAHVVTQAFVDGCDLVYLQSSDAGHGLYRRLGFRDVEEYVLLSRPVA